jgi:hypothetical protein
VSERRGRDLLRIRRLRRVPRSILTLLVPLVFVACNGSAQEASPAEPSDSASLTSAPSKSRKPVNFDNVRLEGTYGVTYRLTSANVSFEGPEANRAEKRKWTFSPDCGIGACTTRIDSRSPRGLSWHVRASHIEGQYRWSQTVRNRYSCELGGSTTPISAAADYAIEVTGVQLMDGAWVGNSFTGQVAFVAVSRCGDLPITKEMWSLTGGSGTTTEAAPVEASPVARPICKESAIGMPVDKADACLVQIARDRGYTVDPQLGAFTVAYQVCSAYTVKELAAEFRTDPVPASAAAAYAVDLFEPEAQRAAAEGCFLALT